MLHSHLSCLSSKRSPGDKVEQWLEVELPLPGHTPGVQAPLGQGQRSRGPSAVWSRIIPILLASIRQRGRLRSEGCRPHWRHGAFQSPSKSQLLVQIKEARKQGPSLTLKFTLLKQHAPLQNTLRALSDMNIPNLSPLPLVSCPPTPSAPVSRKGTPQPHVGLTPKIHSGMDPATEFSYRFSFPPDC